MKAKQTLIAILAISATTAMASNQKDFVGMSVGTGISVEYGRDIDNDLTLRTTTNHLRWSRNFSWSNTSFNGKAKLESYGVNIDWYPSSKSQHYLSAGLHYNRNRLEADGVRKFNYRIGRIRGTEQANTSLSVKYNKVAPYLGVGYRNRQASNSGWQFTYNAGVLYQGKAKVRHNDFCGETFGCVAPDDTRIKRYVRNYDYDKYMSDIEKKTKHRFVPVVQVGFIKRF